MTERPQPPSEDDLPEELSFVEVPAGAKAPTGIGSRGALGILIAALLGSVTAIGLFTVAKPYLIGPDPPEQEEPAQVSQQTVPANTSEESKPQRNASSQNRVNRQGVTTTPSVKNQQTSPQNNQSEIATTDPDSTDEPFPGLNAKLNNVIPLQPGNPSETVLVNPTEPTPTSVVRHPKPAQDAIVQASKEVDSIFLPQIRGAKTREAKMLLVNVLKKAALAEPEGSATRFACLEQAIELAVEAPDSDLTNELVSVMTAEFDVAAYDYHLQALEAWDRMKMPDMDPAAEREMHRLLARKAATLGDLAYDRKDFKTAAGMYAISSRRRDRADDKDVADLFDKKRTAARTKEVRQTLARSLLGDRETFPDDAAKSLEAGIACLQAGLWDEGLKCLSEGNDETLRNFAQKQLQLRSSPITRLSAGDHSWDAVRDLDRRHSIWLKELAIADYESVFMELSPLQFQKVKLRVQQVGPVSCLLPAPLQHFAFELDEIGKIKRDLIVRNRMGHYGNGQLYGDQQLEPGIRGAAVQFNGREGMVVCPQTENLLPGDSPFTISLWIHSGGSQDAAIAGRMYHFNPGVEPDFQLSMLSNGYCRATMTPEQGNAISVQSADPLPHGQWVHLAMTWDLAALTIYIDGRKSVSLNVTVPYPQRILANRHWVAIGGEDPPNNSSHKRFQGRIDEFRVYDQALSSLQIFHVYLKDQAAED